MISLVIKQKAIAIVLVSASIYSSSIILIVPPVMFLFRIVLIALLLSSVIIVLKVDLFFYLLEISVLALKGLSLTPNLTTVLIVLTIA